MNETELSGYLLPCFTLISSQLIRFNVALLFGLTTQYKFVLCYFLLVPAFISKVTHLLFFS